jgi:antitoxin (DNA-binding transcriptional repressor) of toxin-antitoxin stability system
MANGADDSAGETGTAIGVTAFKAQCLALIDQVARGKTSRVVLLRHNRPVAAIVPVADDTGTLWGALRGSVTVEHGVDLTDATGEMWDASA